MAGSFVLSVHPVLNSISAGYQGYHPACTYSPRVFNCPGFLVEPVAIHQPNFTPRYSVTLCKHRLSARAAFSQPFFSNSMWSGQSSKPSDHRLHALGDTSDGRDDSGEAEREGRLDGQGRGVSSAEETDLQGSFEQKSDWEAEENDVRASASTKGGGVDGPEKSVDSLESASEGAADEDTETRRVLDILHGRGEPPQSPVRSLEERFGGFRVSGPQVPLTLRPLKARKPQGTEGSSEAPPAPEDREKQLEREQLSESQEPGKGAESLQVPLEDPETRRESIAAEVVSVEAPQLEAEESSEAPPPKADNAAEEEIPDNKGGEKSKPVGPPAGPPVAEIPIPPRTEEDERLIAAIEKKLNSDWKVEGLESELGLFVAKVRALEDFKKELARQDDDIDLVRASALIAQHAYPECTPEACEAELRLMAEDLKQALPPPSERYPLRMLKAINKFLYTDKGFKGSWGSDRDLYSAELLCINKVLANKTGLPILLSLVYMELARRVGFPMVGVNLPLHFVIRPMASDTEYLVDAHDGGKLMFLNDVQDKLASVFNAKILVSPNFFDNIPPVTKRDFLVRILTNLKRKYFQNRNFTQCLSIIEYLKVAKGGGEEGASEFRDAGLCLFALRRIEEATDNLGQYLLAAPDAPDASTMRDLLQRIREGRL